MRYGGVLLSAAIRSSDSKNVYIEEPVNPSTGNALGNCTVDTAGGVLLGLLAPEATIDLYLDGSYGNYVMAECGASDLGTFITWIDNQLGHSSPGKAPSLSTLTSASELNRKSV